MAQLKYNVGKKIFIFVKNNYMTTVDSIKELFTSLNRSEQMQLLKDLETLSVPLIPKGDYTKSCPHCQSTTVIKYGKHKEEQRFLCKKCNKTYKETTGTAIDRIHKKDKFLECQNLMINKGYSTLESISKELNISQPTAFTWRHKILLSLPKTSSKFEGETQLDDLWFGYSQKGRKGLDYSRKRGGIKKQGDNDFQVKIVTTTDGDQTEMNVAKIGRISTIDLHRVVGDKISKNATLISDKHQSIAAFANQNNLKHITFKASEHTNAEGKGVQLLNNIAGRLDNLINRTFRGVSTKYLQLYTNWFKFKENNKGEILDTKLVYNNMLSLKRTWDLYTNLEKIYEKFILNHSKRTYRCPVTYKVKAHYWNGDIISLVNYSNL